MHQEAEHPAILGPDPGRPAGRRRRLPGPAVAPGDRYVSVGDMRRLYAAIPARPKRLVVAPAGAGHG
jgi:hypothetical protein